jgi:hypothetical protein
VEDLRSVLAAAGGGGDEVGGGEAVAVAEVCGPPSFGGDVRADSAVFEPA